MLKFAAILIVAILVIGIGVVLFFTLNKPKEPVRTVDLKPESLTTQTNSQTPSQKSSTVLGKKTFSINLDSVESSISGTAKFSEVDDRVSVDLSLKGATGDSKYSAFIQKGNCQNPMDITHALVSIENGQSTTILSASLGQLLYDLPQTVVVYPTSENSSNSVACGNLKV